MPEVSVIVPVYNSEKYLPRCLNSLINQTLKDIEIICVNDGSNDSSLTILENYSKIDSRIRLFSEENKGQSAARNFGIKEAKGKYISFVDSDDFVDDNFFEILFNLANKNNVDIAFGGVIRENKHFKKVLIEYKKIEILEKSDEKFKKAYIPKYCFACNKIFLKDSLFKFNLFFKEDFLYEDMIFTPRAVFELGKIITVPNVFYHYWKNPCSTIKQDSDKSRADKLEANKILTKLCLKAGLKKEKNELVLKSEYHFLGIKIIKVYQYRATKRYYLFGFIPFLVLKENI